MTSSEDSFEAAAGAPPAPTQMDPRIQLVEDWPGRGLEAPQNRHGQTVRVWAEARPGRAAEAIAYAALSELSWRFTADTPANAPGDTAALYPMALMHTGFVASYMNEIFGAADIRDIDIHELALIQDSYYLAGNPHSTEAPSAQALPLELEIRIASSAGADELGEMLISALSAAPQNGLLRQSTDWALSLTSDGALIPLDDAGLPGPPAAELLGEWSWADDTSTGPLPLVATLSATPAGPVSPQANAAETRAPLHGRAECRLGPDGGKQITHRWRGRPGPAYTFLSDDAEGFGGQSLAPDAATYMATALALSFVTQLARAAATELTGCRARIDLHFPFGGLIEPGTANRQLDPLEIQIVLAGADNAASARELLARSQRACPLQALCRTRLVTNMRIRRV